MATRTRIVCRAADGIFNDNKMCTSDEIVYDPEEGCLTYEVLEDLDLDEEEWEEDDLIDDEEDDLGWDDDDLFLDDDLDEDLEEDDNDKWSL